MDFWVVSQKCHPSSEGRCCPLVPKSGPSLQPVHGVVWSVWQCFKIAEANIQGLSLFSFVGESSRPLGSSPLMHCRQPRAFGGLGSEAQGTATVPVVYAEALPFRCDRGPGSGPGGHTSCPVNGRAPFLSPICPAPPLKKWPWWASGLVVHSPIKIPGARVGSQLPTPASCQDRRWQGVGESSSNWVLTSYMGTLDRAPGLCPAQSRPLIGALLVHLCLKNK